MKQDPGHAKVIDGVGPLWSMLRMLILSSFAGLLVSCMAITAGAAEGQHVVEGEAELNWRVYDRWHLIGFIGSGKAFGQNKLKQKVDFSYAKWRSSEGIGFRYEIARKFGL
jgi:hypothetical protein